MADETTKMPDTQVYAETIRRGRKHKHASTADSRALGEALRQLIDVCGYDLSDMEDRNAFLDHLQRSYDPPRRTPIADAVLKEWLSGELLPGPNEHLALSVLVEQTKGETAMEEDVDELETVYDRYEQLAGIRKGVISESYSEIARLLGLKKVGGVGKLPAKGTLWYALCQKLPGYADSTVYGAIVGHTSYTVQNTVQAVLWEVIAEAELSEEARGKATAALERLRAAGATSEDMHVGRNTELAVLMKYLKESSGMTHETVAGKLYDDYKIVSDSANKQPKHGGANQVSNRGLTFWLDGTNQPPACVVGAFTDMFKDQPEARLLAPLFLEGKRHEALSLFEQGQQACKPEHAAADTVLPNQPGLLLKALREHVDMSLEEFAKGYCSAVMWHHYENDTARTKGKGKSGIPKRPEVRQAIIEHALARHAEGMDKLAEELGIVPEPFIMGPNGEGLSKHTVFPINPEIEAEAKARYDTLMELFVNQQRLKESKYDFANPYPNKRRTNSVGHGDVGRE